MPPLDSTGVRLAGTPLEAAWRADTQFVVVGAGALGSEVFRNLCLVRPARILVIDPDRVEETDLVKSWLLAAGSVGCPKASQLAALGRGQLPATEFRALNCEFADVGSQELSRASLVFSCVDNDLARLEIALVCRKLGISICDAGLATNGASAGRVSWFPARSGACFGCKLRPQRLRDLLLLAQAEVRSCSVDPADGGFSLTPTMASLIASLQVDFGIRQWLANAQQSESLELALDPHPILRQFENSISAACPLHEERSCEMQVPIWPGARFNDLLASDLPPGSRIVLDWPYCTLAKCCECGHEWQPFVRCARLRHSGHCPACGASTLLELDSIKVIEKESAWSQFTPEQLGLPPNPVLTVRFPAYE